MPPNRQCSFQVTVRKLESEWQLKAVLLAAHDQEVLRLAFMIWVERLRCIQNLALTDVCTRGLILLLHLLAWSLKRKQTRSACQSTSSQVSGRRDGPVYHGHHWCSRCYVKLKHLSVERSRIGENTVLPDSRKPRS